VATKKKAPNKRVPIKQVMHQLAASDPTCQHDDGRPHYSAIAAKCNVITPTIMRLFKSDSSSRQVSNKVGEKIAEAFGVTLAQVQGFEPIDDNFSAPENQRLTDAQILFVLRGLSIEDRDEVLAFARAKAVIAARR